MKFIEQVIIKAINFITSTIWVTIIINLKAITTNSSATTIIAIIRGAEIIEATLIVKMAFIIINYYLKLLCFDWII